MDYQNYQYNQYNYPQTYRNLPPQPNILVFGILSLAISTIPGIILGAIGRKKGNEYLAMGGTLTGAAKVGYILCKAGIIVGIIATVVAVIYGIIFGLALAESASSSYYY